MKEPTDQARRYSRFAEQLREAAQDMQEAARRQVLLTMAEDYELMAVELCSLAEPIGAAISG